MHFPSFSEGLSLRLSRIAGVSLMLIRFPFLFGRAFIEARAQVILTDVDGHFPSFSEGLSLRPASRIVRAVFTTLFPFLFGRAFIEAK